MRMPQRTEGSKIRREFRESTEATVRIKKEIKQQTNALPWFGEGTVTVFVLFEIFYQIVNFTV